MEEGKEVDEDRVGKRRGKVRRKDEGGALVLDVRSKMTGIWCMRSRTFD